MKTVLIIVSGILILLIAFIWWLFDGINNGKWMG